MGTNLRKYLYLTLILCISFSSLIFEHIDKSTTETTLPQGANAAVIYNIGISTQGVPEENAEIWQSLTIRNTGSITLNQLTFYLCEDSNTNNILDENELRLADSFDFSSYGGILTINNIDIEIDGGTTCNYFVVVDIAPTADRGPAMLAFNIVNAHSTADGLLDFEGSSFVTLSSNYYINNRLSRNYNISALTFAYKIASKNIFFKDYSEKALVFFNLKAYENRAMATSLNLRIYSNYDDNCGYISIYEDIGTLYSLDGSDDLILTRSVANLSNFILNIDSPLVNSNTSRNFLLSYTPADTVPIGTTLDIDFHTISGAGENTTLYDNYVYCIMPSIPTREINAYMGGISLNITDESPDIVYNQPYLIPIYTLNIYSYFTSSTLNNIEIINDTSYTDIIFSNSATKNYIDKILIYKDSNFNNTHDAKDKIITTINYGDYVFSDTDTIIATINKSISEYNSTEDMYTLFIYYLLTNNVEEKMLLQSQISAGSYTEQSYGSTQNILDFTSPIINALISELGKLVIENYPTTAINVFAQGSNDNIVYYVILTQTGSPNFDYIRWESLSIKNTGLVSDNHLDFFIYKDSNKNHVLEDSELLAENMFSTNLDKSIASIIKIYDIGDRIDNGTSTNYFITTKLASTSNYGYNTPSFPMGSLTLESASYSGIKESIWTTHDNAIVTGDTLSLNFSVSAMQLGYFITNNLYFYNDKQAIPFLFLNVETFVDYSDSLYIHSAIEANSSTALGDLALFEDQEPLLVFNDNDTYISSFDISSGADLTFACPTIGIGVSISPNLIMVYTPDQYLEAGTSIDITLTQIYGYGRINNNKLEVFSSLPSKDILIAGISINIISNIQNSVFIGNMEVPILQLEVKSYYTSSTINRMLLKNVSDIEFHQGNSNQNRVEGLYVYNDSNNNKIWDLEDSKLINLSRDDYRYNSLSNDELILTFNSKYPTYNTESDESLYFINYKLAPNVESSKSSTAKISDLTFIAPNNSLSHSLYSHLDTIASISFTTGEADIYFRTYNSLASSSIIQGEKNSPVIAYQAMVINYIPSMSITVSHNLPLLTGDDTGIKRISLIEDITDDQCYNLGDILHDFKTTFNSLTTVNLTMQELNKISSYLYNFLLVYDFGSDIPTSQFSNDILRITIRKSSANPSINVAGLFPIPNPEPQISITQNQIKLNLIRITPSVINLGTNPEIHFVFSIQNNSTSTISVTNIFPQFYKNDVSSLNVSYQYNLYTSSNLPAEIGQNSMITVSYLASPNLTFEAGNLQIDGFLEYALGNKLIHLHRKKLFAWESISSEDATTVINIPTYDIFYLEYPKYISKLEKESFGVTSDFRNGEIIEYGNYLLIHFIRKGQEMDLLNTKTFLNDTQLSSFSSPSSLQYDISNGIIRIGPIQESDGSILIEPIDQAQNPYPSATIKYYMNTDLFIHDFLVYPSKVPNGSLLSDPMRIGFLLSKPASVNLYLFNSNGQLIWNTKQIYNTYGYKELSFNGELNSGQNIPKGMYLLKLVAKDLGAQVYEKTITKFIVY